ASFFDKFSGKCKRSGRSEDDVISLKAKPGRCRDIVEVAGFSSQVVVSMAGFEMVVVWASVEREMPVGYRFAAVGVVSHFISPEDIGSVVDFHIAVKFVKIAVFLLLIGTNCGGCGILLRRLCSARRVGWFIGSFLQIL